MSRAQCVRSWRDLRRLAAARTDEECGRHASSVRTELSPEANAHDAVLVSGRFIEVNRFEVFGEGVEVLRPLMSSHGCEFGGEYGHQYYSIVGRGEEVVRGEFSRGNRRLELEVWYSLGPVNYRIG